MNKIKKVLQELSDQFTVKERQDKTKFTCLKDDTSKLIKDNFRDLIHRTEFTPDDYRYETAQGIVSSILEYDFTDIDDIEQYKPEICDGLTSVYNSELITWLASHSLRQEYCNEAISLQMTNDNILSIIQCGQHLEIEEIFQGVIAYYEAMTE